MTKSKERPESTEPGARTQTMSCSNEQDSKRGCTPYSPFPAGHSGEMFTNKTDPAKERDDDFPHQQYEDWLQAIAEGAGRTSSGEANDDDMWMGEESEQ